MLSHGARNYTDKEKWRRIKNTTPVRIQSDPERDLYLNPLEHRSIQIGLSNEAVPLYVNEWIQNITDTTHIASEVHSLIEANQPKKASSLLPQELVYLVNKKTARKIELSSQTTTI